jgi:hypothetical protein
MNARSMRMPANTRESDHLYATQTVASEHAAPYTSPAIHGRAYLPPQRTRTHACVHDRPRSHPWRHAPGHGRPQHVHEHHSNDGAHDQPEEQDLRSSSPFNIRSQPQKRQL